MSTNTDPTTTRQLGPVAEGNLQQLEACVTRTQVDNVVNDANRKALVELARYFEVYDGNSRALKEQLAPLVADAYWAVRTPSLPEQADATLASIDAVLAEVDANLAPDLAEVEAELAPVQGPAAPEAPEVPELVLPSLVDLVNQGMGAQEAINALRKLQQGGTKAKAAPKARAAWMPGYAEALAAKKAKARPDAYPVKLTEAERVAYIQGVLADYPDADMGQAMEVAAWLEGQTMTRTTWARCWALATGAQPA
jgi:hypothetical protein